MESYGSDSGQPTASISIAQCTVAPHSTTTDSSDRPTFFFRPTPSFLTHVSSPSRIFQHPLVAPLQCAICICAAPAAASRAFHFLSVSSFFLSSLAIALPSPCLAPCLPRPSSSGFVLLTSSCSLSNHIQFLTVALRVRPSSGKMYNEKGIVLEQAQTAERNGEQQRQ